MQVENLANNLEEVAEVLRSGKIVVLRTDTLYGIIARADDEAAVRRLQQVRQREPGKAFIVLVDQPSSAYGSDQAKITRAYAMYEPTRPTSVVIAAAAAPQYLQHRDGSLAYRVPAVASLQSLLKLTGPLVAPSANPAGLAPSRSIADAKSYFGDAVALYVDDGVTPEGQKPSDVISVSADGAITQLR